MQPGLGPLVLTLVLACTLLPVASVITTSRVDNRGLVSLHKEVVKDLTNIEDKLNGLNGLKKAADASISNVSKGSRRRRRGKTKKKKGSKKSSRRRRRRRRRRRSSKTARRRRRRSSGGGGAPTPTPTPTPPATKADARPQKIEAGWGDMAKMGEFFTLFITGSGFDPAKDRALVIHGHDTCGSSSARIATVLGSGDVPSGVAGWSSLKCNGLTSSSSKLACGDGERDGVKFPDDKWVDTYNFKVCVCDFSKKNRCSNKGDFDTTPSRPTLKVNPVV